MKLKPPCGEVKRHGGRSRWRLFGGLWAVALLAVPACPALATVKIEFWHAMSGGLGRQLDKMVADFNASQSEYRVVATLKGGYTETITAAIFAVRTRSQPAIVQ